MTTTANTPTEMHAPLTLWDAGKSSSVGLQDWIVLPLRDNIENITVIRKSSVFFPDNINLTGDLVSPASSSPATREAMARLDRLKGFGCDWDGEGAEPIDHEAIEHARAFIMEQAKEGYEPNLVMPGRDGQVHVEYAGSGDRFAKVSIFAEGYKRTLIYDGVDAVTEDGFNVDFLRGIGGHISKPTATKKKGNPWLRFFLPKGR